MPKQTPHRLKGLSRDLTIALALSAATAILWYWADAPLDTFEFIFVLAIFYGLVLATRSLWSQARRRRRNRQ